MRYEIKSYWPSAILFSTEADSMKSAILSAIESGANLIGVDLREADLREADLSDADLICADLSDADLRSANLRGAYLRGANLANVRDLEWVDQWLAKHS